MEKVDNMKCPLGDGISELTLLDKMGSDMTIANDARVSYLGESKGEVKDKKLVHYLFKNKHMTPFRHQFMKFRVKCPLFVARQWRTHNFASYEDVQWVFNEQSGRYVEMQDEFYESKPRLQAKDNKQGSIVPLGHHPEAMEAWWEGEQKHVQKQSTACRDASLGMGIAKELANRLLPQNVYTSFIWTVNLDALMNFLTLRMHPHAQWEIRMYACALYKILKQEFPWVAECYDRYQTVTIDTTKEKVITISVDSKDEYYKGTDYVSTD